MDYIITSEDYALHNALIHTDNVEDAKKQAKEELVNKFCKRAAMLEETGEGKIDIHILHVVYQKLDKLDEKRYMVQIEAEIRYNLKLKAKGEVAAFQKAETLLADNCISYNFSIQQAKLSQVKHFSGKNTVVVPLGLGEEVIERHNKRKSYRGMKG
jgi:hypothetical protein